MFLLVVLEFAAVVDAALVITVVVVEDVSAEANGPPMTAPTAAKTNTPAMVCKAIDVPELPLRAR